MNQTTFYTSPVQLQLCDNPEQNYIQTLPIGFPFIYKGKTSLYHNVNTKIGPKMLQLLIEISFKNLLQNHLAAKITERPT